MNVFDASRSSSTNCQTANPTPSQVQMLCVCEFRALDSKSLHLTKEKMIIRFRIQKSADDRTGLAYFCFCSSRFPAVPALATGVGIDQGGSLSFAAVDSNLSE